jgi:RecA/RadA recombinase
VAVAVRESRFLLLFNFIPSTPVQSTAEAEGGTDARDAMRRVELSTLSLLPKHRAHLVKAQLVYADQVLLSTPLHLARQTKLSVQDCTALLTQVAKAVTQLEPPSPKDDRELVAFTTGDSELDHFLDAYPGRGGGKGIRLGHITELAGQSSSGKTNLCLQLACTVQLPLPLGGVHGGALFLSSEGTLPSRRLVQLASHFATLTSTYARTAKQFLDNVHVETAPDADTLVALLTYHVPTAIDRINYNSDPALLPIRLLIVDSIAAPFRSAHETGSNGFAQRAKEFAEIGDALKALAARYHLAVVVVNQVSDVWDARGRNLPPSFLLDDEDDDLDSGGDEDKGGGGVDGEKKHDGGAGVTPHPAALIKPRNNPTTPIGTGGPPRQTSSHGHGYGYGLPPPPHRQYSFPSLLYSRFQSPHLTGSFSSVSHPSLLPLPPGFHHHAPSSSSSEQQQQPVAAALGHTWSQIPTSRILCLVRRSSTSTTGATRTRRCMTMVWSPFAPRGCIEYEIDPERGIVARGEVRVRAVPGYEIYEEEEEGGDVGGRGGGGGGDKDRRDEQHDHNEAGD